MVGERVEPQGLEADALLLAFAPLSGHLLLRCAQAPKVDRGSLYELALERAAQVAAEGRVEAPAP